MNNEAAVILLESQALLRRMQARELEMTPGSPEERADQRARAGKLCAEADELIASLRVLQPDFTLPEPRALPNAAEGCCAC